MMRQWQQSENRPPIQLRSRPRLRLQSNLIVTVVAFVMLLSGDVEAAQRNVTQGQTTQNVRYDSSTNALRQGSNPVWADVREERVTFGRALPAHQDLSDRHIDTVNETVSQSRNTNAGGGSTSTWSGFSAGDWLVFLFRTGLVILCITLVIWVVALMLKSQENRWRKLRMGTGGDAEDLAAQRAKLTDLPFEMESTLVGFKAQADRYRQEKQYAKATVYLFSYLLVECDAANGIRLAKGKTNHRYVRELNAWPQLQRSFQELVEMFEATFFGGKEISESKFEAFWDQLPKVEAMVQECRTAKNLGVGPMAGLVVWGMLGLSLAGCKQQINSVYGESDSYVGECSPSGLTVFRELAQDRGFRTQRMESLSPAMHTSVQTIVWMPDRFPMHQAEVLRALQVWLQTGDKTLIYVGRDASPQAEYWKEVIDGTGNGPSNPSELSRFSGLQRVRALQEGANATLALDLRRDEARDLMVTPWFYARKELGPVRRIKQFTGPWADAFQGRESRVVARMTLRPYVEDGDVGEQQAVEEAGQRISAGVRRVEELRKELDWEGQGRAFTGGMGIFRGGIVPQMVPPGQEYAREFMPEDRQQLEIISNVHVGDYERVKRWLVGGDGEELVLELSHATSTSRVLLVANGSLVSNMGMLRGSHREIADRILGRCTVGTIGFLGGEKDPLVRESGEVGEQGRGVEVFTLWPMNVFTIHLAVAAMIGLLAFYPVFGRPRNGEREVTSDFGEHVQAVGEMLRGTQDSGYAKRTIAKYFRVVRGDTVSDWSSLDRSDTDQ